MPPKKKKGKKEEAKKKLQTPLDDIDTTVLTQEKLIEFCVRVNVELNSERQHSDFLRLDRDKLVNMVAIANEQLEELKTQHWRCELELRDGEEAHRRKMAENRQKFIHLALEKDEDGLRESLESARVRAEENAGHRERMERLAEDAREVKEKLAELDGAMKDNTLRLQTEHAEEKHGLREKDKEVSVLTENAREKTLAAKTESLNAKFRAAYEELERRKNRATSDLLKCNAKLADDLNNYYNKILRHNTRVTAELKSSWKEEKRVSAQTEVELTALRSHRAALKDELQALIDQEFLLQQKLRGSKRDQHELKRVKSKLELGAFELDHMRWALETLKIRETKQEERLKEEINKVEEREFSKKKRSNEVLLAWEYVAFHLYYKHKEADSIMGQIREIYRARGRQWPSALEELSEHPGPDVGRYLAAEAVAGRARLAAVGRRALAAPLGLR